MLFSYQFLELCVETLCSSFGEYHSNEMLEPVSYTCEAEIAFAVGHSVS